MLLIAEIQVDFRDRKFVLVKHLYPNLSLKESFIKLYNLVPVDVTAAIISAMCETMPLQLYDPMSAEPSQRASVSTVRAQRVADHAQSSTPRPNSSGCKFSSLIVLVKMSKAKETTEIDEINDQNLFEIVIKSEVKTDNEQLANNAEKGGRFWSISV
jgi:hypothetical protein